MVKVGGGCEAQQHMRKPRRSQKVSSGNSANIIAAVAAARARGAGVVTLSGFDEQNRLRGLGDFNLYVPSHEYGFVEVTHLALTHALLDMAMGWGAERPPARAPGAGM